MHAELCLEGTTEDKRLKSAMRFWPTDEAEAAGSTGSVAAPEAMEVLMVVMDRGGGGEYFEDDEEGRGHQVMTHDEGLVAASRSLRCMGMAVGWMGTGIFGNLLKTGFVWNVRDTCRA
ncbi:hypothetical protein RHGRI_010681 [Rhododendron griersonianum]|uniref:Uncharacterized protein n=1 Tax=Rhododendron griersonianum TaxID=479676 RepID=A0AAV6KJW8_9ERIC|nr:hypothetical protein RHGRI_010681 [Rhododendron griersonianum]